MNDAEAVAFNQSIWNATIPEPPEKFIPKVLKTSPEYLPPPEILKHKNEWLMAGLLGTLIKIGEFRFPTVKIKPWQTAFVTGVLLIANFGFAGGIGESPTNAVAANDSSPKSTETLVLPISERAGLARSIDQKENPDENFIKSVQSAESKGVNPTSPNLDPTLAIEKQIDIGKMQVRWEAAVDVFKQMGQSMGSDKAKQYFLEKYKIDIDGISQKNITDNLIKNPDFAQEIGERYLLDVCRPMAARETGAVNQKELNKFTTLYYNAGLSNANKLILFAKNKGAEMTVEGVLKMAKANSEKFSEVGPFAGKKTTINQRVTLTQSWLERVSQNQINYWGK